jgi:hypothetical protein
MRFRNGRRKKKLSGRFLGRKTFKRVFFCSALKNVLQSTAKVCMNINSQSSLLIHNPGKVTAIEIQLAMLPPMLLFFKYFRRKK